jgi:hypothetical protein
MVKAKESGPVDKLPTYNTFGCHIRMLCSKFIPVLAFDPWTWSLSVSISPLTNDD